MIEQYINNPQLLTTLTPQQKTQVYQDTQKYLQQLQNAKTKAETELQLKQKEQQELFQQLQQLTQKQTIPEIQEYITSLQSQFDTDLQNILQQFKQLQ